MKCCKKVVWLFHLKRRQSEFSIVAAEGRIKAIQQFIVENEILVSEEV